ncbi:hypothetical protein JJB09_25610 [Rhizobium sp. KVB221]|uniref:Uncharacterized protein n=1 Tax=Rhizobium setariae TaxID=2801340 RepID=A0A936YT74_9HYPH|nr:hypothetical protein [Rhizobium setariae]MBL0375393.1 hypothetical protein [Rhizobium setariae]
MGYLVVDAFMLGLSLGRGKREEALEPVARALRGGNGPNRSIIGAA